MRILIIDDDEQVIRLAQFALARHACAEVVSATSGSEGLRIAEESPFDAVLLDVMMPGLDGPSVLAALREKPATSGLPVIYLSAKDGPEEVAALMQTGARGIIHKPFDPSRLVGEIRARLNRGDDAAVAVAIPDALRADFLVAAGDRLHALDRSLDVLTREPQRHEHLRTVTAEFHRLAGTSASYGFTEVGELARGGEEESHQLASMGTPAEPRAVHRLRERVRRMREQIAAAATPRAPERRGRTVRIVSIDSAPETREALRVLAADRTFTIAFAEDARALTAPLPDVVVARALADVQQLRAMANHHRTAALISMPCRPSSAEVRDAFAAGADGMLDPRDVEQFAGRMRALAERKFGSEPPRVLCVGVERYASSFASVIESAGYDVRIEEDARDLEADIETFDPDVVLADSPELVRRVRMAASGLCPVVLIAWSDAPDLELQAHRAGAIDLLRVPLSRALLLSALENYAVSARECRNAIRRDSLTGSLRDSYFRERLKQRADRGTPVTLATIDVEPTDAVTLVALADLLRARLRDTDDVGRAGDRLLVAMENIDHHNAAALLERLRSEFSSGTRSFRASLGVA